MTPRRYDIRKTRIIAFELHRSFCCLTYPFIIALNQKNDLQPATLLLKALKVKTGKLKRSYEFAPRIGFASVSDTIAYFAPG
jgi:hypothetical protein